MMAAAEEEEEILCDEEAEEEDPTRPPLITALPIGNNSDLELIENVRRSLNATSGEEYYRVSVSAPDMAGKTFPDFGACYYLLFKEIVRDIISPISNAKDSAESHRHTA